MVSTQNNKQQGIDHSEQLLAGQVGSDVGSSPKSRGALRISAALGACAAVAAGAFVLGGLIGATVLFLVADSAAWLFAARAIQGVSTGAALSAASAALVRPRRRPQRERKWARGRTGQDLRIRGKRPLGV
jgi:MFS family permease